jgi:catalase
MRRGAPGQLHAGKFGLASIMPLPTDEKLLQLSRDFIRQFDTMFGLHPGFRPAHAKGTLLTGTFTPTAAAAKLTLAPHMSAPTPVTARFSDGTGFPQIPDNDANASPRGFAVRFNLGPHAHTDIIAHSTDGFPTHTGDEFLEMLQASVSPDQTAIQKFLAEHPAALAFIQTPKPPPSSFAREAFFAVTAMRFTNRAGLSRYGRYRIEPEAGVEHLDDAAVRAKSPDYLFEELAARIAREPIRFELSVQLAGDGDLVNDATVHWPEDRPTVNLGTIELNQTVTNNAAEQQHIIFDPIPRVDGIDPSDDPLLELRASVYLMTGRRRRGSAQAASV